MKIVCEACGAKYFVSDDKIHKRAVRMTCQKCSHVIVARRDEVHAAASQDLRARLGLAPAATAPTPSSPPSLPTTVAVDWYFSRDGQSFGPFTQAALLARFEAGEIGAECYVWHRELGEWSAAHSTAPFAAAIASASQPEPAPVNPLSGSAPAVVSGVAEAVARAAESTAPAQSTAAPVTGGLLSLRKRLEQIDLTDDGDEDDAQPDDAAAGASDDEVTHIGVPDFELGTDSSDALEAPVEPVEPAASAPTAAALDDSPAEETSGAPEPDELPDMVDLDVDGASRLIDVHSMSARADAALAAAAAASTDGDASTSPAELDVEIDLDVDGASRVVSLAQIYAEAGVEMPTDDDGADVIERDAEHIQGQRRRGAMLAVLAVLLVGGLAVGGWWLTRDASVDLETPERSTRSRALTSQGGAEIDAAEFERMAPLAEFSLVEVDDGPARRIDEDGAPDDGDEAEGATSDDDDDESGRQARRRRDRVDRGDDDAGSSATPSLADLEVDDTNDADAGGEGSTGLGSLGATASIKGGSGTTTASSTGSRRRRRERVDLSDQTDDLGAELEDRRGSKYSGSTSSGSAVDRNRFVGGLKRVSGSVMDCQRRHVDQHGPLDVRKVYLTLTVEPSGSVSGVKIDRKVRDTYFASCIKEVKVHWEFAAFEGKAVELRQGFVLE